MAKGVALERDGSALPGLEDPIRCQGHFYLGREWGGFHAEGSLPAILAHKVMLNGILVDLPKIMVYLLEDKHGTWTRLPILREQAVARKMLRELLHP